MKSKNVGGKGGKNDSNEFMWIGEKGAREVGRAWEGNLRTSMHENVMIKYITFYASLKKQLEMSFIGFIY